MNDLNSIQVATTFAPSGIWTKYGEPERLHHEIATHHKEREEALARGEPLPADSYRAKLEAYEKNRKEAIARGEIVEKVKQPSLSTKLKQKLGRKDKHAAQLGDRKNFDDDDDSD